MDDAQRLVDATAETTAASKRPAGRIRTLAAPSASHDLAGVGFEPDQGGIGVLHHAPSHHLRNRTPRADPKRAVQASMSGLTKDYMRLALLDLLGALFVPSDPGHTSLHADRLFARICGVISERFADP